MEEKMEEKFEMIKNECLNADTSDPIELILKLMQKESIRIHGPEHHVLDGSCLLAALHHAGMEFDLNAALDEMRERGKKMPGAVCGQWGVCGSAASIGAALSIVHETGPLSHDTFYKDNLLFVSRALEQISIIGGPRCCKRNAFLSLLTAIDFIREHYKIELPKQTIHCIFSERNEQCIHSRCPFYQISNLKNL